jgi:hypothetical protein
METRSGRAEKYRVAHCAIRQGVFFPDRDDRRGRLQAPSFFIGRFAPNALGSALWVGADKPAGLRYRCLSNRNIFPD